MEAVIRQVLAEHARLTADVDGIAPADDLYELGLTSHASVNVMLALEDRFDVEFPDRFLSRATFASVDSIRSALEEIGSAEHR